MASELQKQWEPPAGVAEHPRSSWGAHGYLPGDRGPRLRVVMINHVCGDRAPTQISVPTQGVAVASPRGPSVHPPRSIAHPWRTATPHRACVSSYVTASRPSSTCRSTMPASCSSCRRSLSIRLDIWGTAAASSLNRAGRCFPGVRPRRPSGPRARATPGTPSAASRAMEVISPASAFVWPELDVRRSVLPPSVVRDAGGCSGGGTRVGDGELAQQLIRAAPRLRHVAGPSVLKHSCTSTTITTVITPAITPAPQSSEESRTSPRARVRRCSARLPWTSARHFGPRPAGELAPGG
jgi:hypothetical protein